MSNLLSITYVLFLAIFALTAVVSLLSLIRFGAGEKSLIQLEPKYRFALFSSLLLEVVAVIIVGGYKVVNGISEETKKLRYTIERRQPSTLHDYVLLQRDITADWRQDALQRTSRIHSPISASCH